MQQTSLKRRRDVSEEAVSQVHIQDSHIQKGALLSDDFTERRDLSVKRSLNTKHDSLVEPPIKRPRIDTRTSVVKQRIQSPGTSKHNGRVATQREGTDTLLYEYKDDKTDKLMMSNGAKKENILPQETSSNDCDTLPVTLGNPPAMKGTRTALGSEPVTTDIAAGKNPDDTMRDADECGDQSQNLDAWNQGDSDKNEANLHDAPQDMMPADATCECDQLECLECYPCSSRATHCGSNGCIYCAKRRPGFSFWNSTREKDMKEIFTPGVSALAKAYDGKKNVLVMVMSESAMEVTQASVMEGRRFRAVKHQIDSDLNALMKGLQPALRSYMEALASLKHKKRDIRRQGDRVSRRQKSQLWCLQADLKVKQRIYRSWKSECLVLKSKLKSAEQRWMASMRHVEHEHEYILEDAKLIPTPVHVHWTDKNYNCHTFIQDIKYKQGDIYAGEDTDAGISDDDMGYDHRGMHEGLAQHRFPSLYEDDIRDSAQRRREAGRTYRYENRHHDSYDMWERYTGTYDRTAAPQRAEVRDGYDGYESQPHNVYFSGGQKQPCHNPKKDNPYAELQQGNQNAEATDPIKRHHLDQLKVLGETLEIQQQRHEDIRRSYTVMFNRYVDENPGRPRTQLGNEYGPQYVKLGQVEIAALRKAEDDYKNAKVLAKEAGVKVDEDEESAQNDAEIEAMNAKAAAWSMKRTKPEVIHRYLEAEMEPLPPGTTFLDLEQDMYPQPHKLNDDDDEERPRVADDLVDSISVYNVDPYFRDHIDNRAKTLREGYY